MQWTKAETDNQVSFELSEPGKIISRITFDKYKSYQEADCEIDGGHYTIKPGSFWNSNTLLVDEQGKEVASIMQERENNRKWIVTINNNEYQVYYHTKPLFELVTYSDDFIFLLTYKVSTRHAVKQIDLAFHEALQKVSEKNILATLGWYLFIPVVEENVMSDALVM